MACCHCQGVESVFSARYVRSEVKRYRRKGPRVTTKLLVAAIKAEGAQGSNLLDIGGGVGPIHHELLKSGVGTAVAAEASTAYLSAAEEEARRQGHADRVTYRQGDFIELAPEIESADIVTLDRVICCYPDMESLVGLSLGKARRIYALVYPRDAWWTRVGIRLLNLGLWLSRNPFRVFVHPEFAVDALVRGAGFERRYLRKTPAWQVVVYRRTS